jgi:hypothetical protein
MNFWPELSLPVQHAFQSLNGALLLLVLGHQLAPHWQRLLTGERWGGCAQSDPVADLLHRPAVAPVVLFVWAGCAVALVCDSHPVFAALVNVLLCRYYFVAMRWRGVGRGFGAPGFMTYWLGLAVLLLALTRRHTPGLQPLAVLWLQLDLALIIFSSGVYKLRSGYFQGEGMDYGLVNPMWSYWPDAYRRLPSTHGIFRFFNHSAWTSQLASAILMVIPATRWLGGLSEIITYVFIATQIRLGWLAEQMIVGGLLFFTLGSPIGVWWDAHWAVPDLFGHSSGPAPGWLGFSLQAYLWLQLVLTPLCHAGLFFNFYGRRRLPAPLQRGLDAYANFFGVIIWRVFSVDHLNFHVNIYRTAGPQAERVRLSQWRNPRDLRFWHVGEAIIVTSLFTTLKYYPSNDAIFCDRLLRYARTLPCPVNDELIFEYVSIQKLAASYIDRVVCCYHVNPRSGAVRCVVVDPHFSPKSAHAASPLHEASRPGSYAPKAT